MGPRNLLSLRITFICFTLIFILGLTEGVFLAMTDEPTARVGHVAVFLSALLPGTIVGLLSRSARKALLNALVAGLPALIIILLIAGFDRTLRFYPSFGQNQAPLIDRYVFRVLIFGLQLVVSTAAGHFVAGEAVAETQIFAVREIEPGEELEELEKRIEDQVLKEKLSGVSLVEEARKSREAEQPPGKEVEAPPPAERTVTTKLCPSCGTAAPSTATYCSSCGRKLEQEQ